MHVRKSAKCASVWHSSTPPNIKQTHKLLRAIVPGVSQGTLEETLDKLEESPAKAKGTLVDTSAPSHTCISLRRIRFVHPMPVESVFHKEHIQLLRRDPEGLQLASPS